MGDAVSGKDWSTQNRDLAKAVDAALPMSKIAFSGYARFPIALAVDGPPWAILAVRIQSQVNAQPSAPQGGFCAFAYDGIAGVANVTAINALDGSTASPLPTNTIFDFSFLAVF